MTMSERIDAAFAYLEDRVATLEQENAELLQKNSELLGQLIAAQDSAYTRMVRSNAGMPVVDGAPLPDNGVKQ